ncbi:hypothetical protein PybrP1_011482 [[Pythium] brassicae (nom. inval.)]|nr:hypothetical protein PybrP1_011482 [[Pythium] brassicae (nom. inval.)]
MFDDHQHKHDEDGEMARKEGVTLRARVRRTTPLMDIAIAVVLGGASGVYIFNDSMRRWQQSELEFAAGQSSTGDDSGGASTAATADAATAKPQQ